jgi:hypothetical protein
LFLPRHMPDISMIASLTSELSTSGSGLKWDEDGKEATK